jgi:hypothetical protein
MSRIEAMKKVLWLILSMCCVTGAVSAADVTGTWKAQLVTPSGAATLTFSLKQDSTKLTGTVRLPQGVEVQLIEGKVDGNSIAFAFDNTFDGHRYTSTGTIKAETITVTWTPGDDMLTLERQK